MQYSAPQTAAFPVLRVDRDGISAKGSFAEAQASFLRPDARLVRKLDELLKSKRIGVVAHFYMDPELQGVLASCTHPHIHVSDSLVMADRAVKMAKEGAERIVVLGVDFMSENVRAMLDVAGYSHVPVYRAAEAEIGCSLAEAAESAAYRAYLERAHGRPRALHVVYINTSLRTKALAQGLVPTITCTSSNVVKTVLQAAAQVPDVEIFFGPDTYMGENLRSLFESLLDLDDEAIAALHPAHDRESVRALLERFHYFEEGACIVHHMFGEEVVRRVREEHPGAFVTAHLEVPGEMFALGLEAQREGRGVVGSTSNILGFIDARVKDAIARESAERMEFVLGTEAGMITPIVRDVEAMIAEAARSARKTPTVDIVFPVASEAIAETGEAALPVIPGVASGEGCSTAGGCATCPYMKMNSLRALLSIAERVGEEPDAALGGLFPKHYQDLIFGKSAAELGGVPILHMRGFQAEGVLPEELVRDIASERAAPSP
jgi:quinolinate synthase